MIFEGPVELFKVTFGQIYIELKLVLLHAVSGIRTAINWEAIP